MSRWVDVGAIDELKFSPGAPVKVDDIAFIATSFPDFVPMMQRLGAVFA